MRDEVFLHRFGPQPCMVQVPLRKSFQRYSAYWTGWHPDWTMKVECAYQITIRQATT